LTKDSSGNIEFKDASNNRKKIIVEEILIGSGDNQKTLKVENGKSMIVDNSGDVVTQMAGHIMPHGHDIYDLGSPTAQWRDLYLSSGSLYIDGTQVISSTSNVLTVTTDTGQSLKLLETGADDITIQTDTGNIELKGTVEILSGKKLIDSAGTIIQFGDSLGITGSIEVSGTVDGIDLQSMSSSLESRISTLTGKTIISSSAQIASDISGSNTAFSASVATRFEGLTTDYTELDNIPNNIISSSAQIASEISGSFTSASNATNTKVDSNTSNITSINAATSSYLKNTTDTLTGDLTVTGTITAQEFHTEYVSASVIYQSGSTNFGDTSDDIHNFTGSLNVDGNINTTQNVSIPATKKIYLDGGSNTYIAETATDTVKIYTGGSTRLALAPSYAEIFTTTYIPDYIIHTGDADSKFGFEGANEFRISIGGDLNYLADADGNYLYHNALQKMRTTSGGIYVTGDAVASSTVVVGNNNSIFAENNLRFKSAGAAYIDHNTVGQSINFRTSTVSSLDTTPLSLAGANATFTGDITMTQSSGNNILFINSSGGGNPVIYMQDSTRKWGQFVASGDLYFKNETTNVNTLILNGSNATFAGTIGAGAITSTSTVTGTRLVANGTGNAIELNQSSTGAATYYVMDNTVETGGKRYRFGYSGGSSDKGSFSIYNQTDSIMPLLLSGANATFAGTVRAEDSFNVYDGAYVYQIRNSSGVFDIRNGNTGAIPLTIDASSNATFGGKILVGTGATAAANINSYSTAVSTGLYSALRVIEHGTASSYWDIGATNAANTLLNFYHNGTTTPKISFTHTGGATFAGNVNITQTTDVGVLNTTNLDNGSAVGLSLTYPTSNVAGGDGLAIAIGIANRGRSYIANSNTSNNLDASNLEFYTEGGGVINKVLTLDQNKDATFADNIKVTNNASIGTTVAPTRTLDVRGTGMSIFGTGGYTELMIRGQVEGTGTVRNVGSWHWSVRSDVGGNNDDLKLLRFITGNYSGVAMQIQNTTGNATFAGEVSLKSRLNLQRSSAGATTLIQFKNENGVDRAHIDFGGTDEELSFFAGDGGSESMRINSTGNVGIGTTNPANKLTVEDTIGIKRSGVGAITTLQQTGAGFTINAPSGYHPLILNYNGSEKARLNNSGNLGIGTTNPVSGLQISTNTTGDANRNTTTAGITLTRYIQGTDYRGSSIFHAYQGISGSDKELLAFAVGPGNSNSPFDFAKTKMVITESGNVGIGTTNPSYKLQVGNLANTSGVKNDIFITGDTVNFNDYYARLIFGNSTQSGGATASIRGERSNGSNYGTSLTFYTNSTASAGNGSERMRIDSSGNVGIGTPGPLTKFDVRGSTFVTGYLAGFDTSPQGNYAYRLTNDSANSFINILGGNLGIGTTAPTAKLEVASSQTNSSIKTGGLEMQSYAVNNSWYAENLYYDGGWKLRNNGHATQMYMEAGIISFKRVASGTAGNFVSPLTTMVLHSSGNVGIGTTLPTTTLTIKGTASNGIAVQGVGTTANRVYAGLDASNHGYLFLAGSSGQNAAKISATGGDSYISGGNVGIGTTGPSAKLDIKGDGADIFLQSNDFKIARIQPRGTGANLDKGLFSLFDGSTENVRIDTAGNSWLNGGNIGIGTTVPSAKLDVIGVGRILMPNDPLTGAVTAKILSYSTAPYGMVFRSYSSGTNSIQVQRESSDSETFALSLQPNNGNVGIGTTSPAGKLDIRSSTTGNLLSRVWNPSTNTTSSTTIRIASSANSANSARLEFSDSSIYTATISGDRVQGLVFRTSSTATNPITSPERMRITPTGNVGIGTTNPSSMLDVVAPSSTTVPTVRFRSAGSYTFLSGGALDPYHGLILRGIPSGATTYGVTAGDQMSFLEYGGDFRFYEKNSLSSGTLNEISRIHKTNSFFLSNVGIGTTTANQPLEIYKSVSGGQGATLRLTNIVGGTGAGSAIEFFGPGTQGIHAKIITQDLGVFDSKLIFQTKASGTGGSLSDRMTIDNSGDVNIGTTFDFNVSTDLLTITNNQNTGGINLSGANSRLYFGGSRAIEGAQDGSNLFIGEGYNEIYLQDNTNVTGNLTVTGTLTAQEFKTELTTSTILYDSGSTKFGDTSDDNHDFTGSLNVQGNVEHTGLTMTSGTDIDQLYSTTKSMTLTPAWQDTGINGTDLATGTYVVAVYAEDYAVGGGHYYETYSGTMTWYDDNTNDTAADEIILHKAGHHSGSGNIYLRTKRTVSADTDDLKLQIAHTVTCTGDSNYVFKFRRLI